jgi:hypothetical protein
MEDILALRERVRNHITMGESEIRSNVSAKQLAATRNTPKGDVGRFKVNLIP